MPGASPKWVVAALLGTLVLVVPQGATAAPPMVRFSTGERIVDGPKANGRLVVGDGYHGRAGFELRGSSSSAFPKKSYSFETRSSGKEGKAVGLLGMPRESDWVLDAAYADPTFMRNALSYKAARILGWWAPRTRLVEFELNGRYRGVHVLTERIKLDGDRVDVREKGLSGGYVAELSDEPMEGGFPGLLSGRFFGYYDPDREDLDRREAAWLEGYVGRVERALYGQGGDWRALVGERAAVDYLLLQELLKNQDAFTRSTFLTKGTNAPLQLGPLWDMDRAVGDLHAGPRAAPEGFVTPGKPWAAQLLADAGFADRVVRRWREIRAEGRLLRRLLGAVDRWERQLRGAHIRDARRWAPEGRSEHRAQVDYLRAWLRARFGWLDANVEALRPRA